MIYIKDIPCYNVSPVRKDDNPEVDGDKQCEDHVGESHPKSALQWTINQYGVELRGNPEIP